MVIDNLGTTSSLTERCRTSVIHASFSLPSMPTKEISLQIFNVDGDAWSKIALKWTHTKRARALLWRSLIYRTLPLPFATSLVHNFQPVTDGGPPTLPYGGSYEVTSTPTTTLHLINIYLRPCQT